MKTVKRTFSVPVKEYTEVRKANEFKNKALRETKSGTQSVPEYNG